MENIIINYWHLSKYDDLKYNHGDTIPHTKAARNRIIDNVIDKGYNVSLQISGNNLIIWINKGKFSQR